MDPITLERNISASYILDWLKRYFSDWKDPVAYGEKYHLAIDPTDTAIAQNLQDWYEGENRDKRHVPEGLPGLHVLQDPRNRVFLNKPQWKTANARTTIVCNGGVSVWLDTARPPVAGPYLYNAITIAVEELQEERTRLKIQAASASVAGFATTLAEDFERDYPEARPTGVKAPEEAEAENPEVVAEPLAHKMGKGKGLSLPDYKESLPAAYWAFVKETGRRPTQEDLALRLIVCSKNIGRRIKDIKDNGGTWPPPQAEV